MLPEGVDIKVGELVAIGILDDLVGQINLDLLAGTGLVSDLLDCGLVLDLDGQHAVLEGVVEEDIGERRGDDTLDAKVKQGPGGVLTRGTASEVGSSHNQDIGLAVDALVKDEIGDLRAVRVVAQLVEQGLAQTGPLDGLQELLGDDSVGVDVGTVHGGGNALEDGELGQTGTSSLQGVGVRLVVLGEVEDPLEIIIRLDVFHFWLDVKLGRGLADGRADGGEFSNIGQLTDNGSSRSHGRGHQMCPAVGTLTALKVAVGGTSASLTGRQDIGVHTQAHGATGLSPLEASIDEDLVEALGLSLTLDQTGTRNNHGTLDVGRNLLALDNVGGRAQVLNTGVGARTDEDLVNLNVLHAGTSLETHVLEGALAAGLAGFVLEVVGTGDNAGDGHDILRRRTPGDGGDDVFSLDEDLLVEHSALVGPQIGPVLDGALPLGRVELGGQRTALEVLESDLVRGDHAGTGASLNGHVAHRHTSLHAQTADDRTAVLDDCTGTTGSADDTDNVEDNILAGDTGRQLTVDVDAHVLALLGEEGLGREDVLDLASSDTEGEGSKGTVGGGVAVTADDGGAGEGETLLGTDDVDDTLTLVVHAKVRQIEVLDVLLEGGDLETGVVLLDELVDILEVLAGAGGDVLGQRQSVSGSNRRGLEYYQRDLHGPRLRECSPAGGLCGWRSSGPRRPAGR